MYHEQDLNTGPCQTWRYPSHVTGNATTIERAVGPTYRRDCAVTYGLLEAVYEAFFQNRSISKNEIVAFWHFWHVWLVRSRLGAFFSTSEYFKK